LFIDKGSFEVTFGEQLTVAPILTIPDVASNVEISTPATEEKVLKSPVKNGRSEISLELYAAESKQKAKAVDVIEEAEIIAESTPEAVLTIPITPVVTPINNVRTSYISFPYKPPPPTSIAYRLNNEIVDYVNYVKRVVQEHNYATAGVMVERVRICVNKLWPTGRLIFAPFLPILELTLLL